MASLTFCSLRNGVNIPKLSRLFQNHCLVQKNTLHVTKVVSTSKRPEKPVPIYIRFVQRNYEKTRAENKGLPPSQVMKTLGQKFKSLSNQERKKLEVEQSKMDEDYQKKLQKWMSSLPPAELDERAEKRDAIKKALRTAVTTKEKGQMGEACGKPKRPTLFGLFMKDDPASRKLAELSKLWGKLSAAEKQKYEDKMKEEMEIFKKELFQWEMNMAKQGQFLVLRKETLKKLLSEL